MHVQITLHEQVGNLSSLTKKSRAETKLIAGLVTWPFCGQITRFWLFYFLFGLEKNVWPFGSILAFFIK
jgi:hypothetical protein